MAGIECIAADGWLILLRFLPKGSLYIEWYKNINIPNFRIKHTPNGEIDDKTAFE